jgi:hypothetical protein
MKFWGGGGWNTLATPTSKCGGLTPLTPAVSMLMPAYRSDSADCIHQQKTNNRVNYLSFLFMAHIVQAGTEYIFLTFRMLLVSDSMTLHFSEICNELNKKACYKTSGNGALWY